jgi:hypothetical protein
MVMVFDLKERWRSTVRCQTVQRRKYPRFPLGTNSNPFRSFPDKIQAKKEALRVDLRKKLFSGPFILRAIYYGEK